jgi:hypothetical protein
MHKQKSEEPGKYIRQFFGDEIVSKLRFGLELSDEDINVISDLQEKWDGVVNGTKNKEVCDTLENTEYIHMYRVEPDDITGMMEELLSKISKKSPVRKRLESIYNIVKTLIGENGRGIRNEYKKI